MRERSEDALNGNLTAMIDVVFQLIIFFVCTSNLQDSAPNTEIALPVAPHGEVVTQKDPREINIDVDARGNISIVRTKISQSLLLGILKKAVAEFGNDIPLIVRADAESEHTAVKKVLDACSSAGLYRIEFAAFKEKAEK
jgi:biopolymer transport protein ExbD